MEFKPTKPIKITYEPGMDVIAMIGDPVSHSVSPIIHNTLFEIYKLKKICLPIHVLRGEVDKLFQIAEALNLKGISITMPHKQAVIPYCDFIDEYAKTSNAVNCIYFREDGIHGANTDAPGLKRAIESDGFTYDNQDILLLGGGAVSRPIALSMAQTAKSITFINRTYDKAVENMNFILDNTNCKASVRKFEPDEMKKAAENCTFVMNTTCLGMHGIDADFTDFSFLDAVPKGSLVSDIIYNPIKTSLLKEAEKRGLPIQNGLPMVIYQGFIAFNYFTGIMPKQEDYKTIIENLGY